MPEFNITYNTRERRRNISKDVKVRAIDETHARSMFIRFAKSVLKKFCRIIFIREL